MTLATMDALDWGIALCAAVMGGALLLWAIGGIDLLAPHPTRSPLSLLALGSFALLLALSLIDTVQPVRTTVYVVNAGRQSFDIAAGGRHGCVAPGSYTVLTWRTTPPRALVINRPDDDALSLPLGPGTWVANPSRLRISADIVDRRGFDQGTLGMADAPLLPVTIGQGKIYRVFSTDPLDRLSTADGDLTSRRLNVGCRVTATTR